MCGLAFVGILLLLFYTLVISLLVSWLLWRLARKIWKRLGGRTARSLPSV
jgi:hypothetical protein